MAKMGVTDARGVPMPLYKPLKKPTNLTVFTMQSQVPLYIGFSPEQEGEVLP